MTDIGIAYQSLSNNIIDIVTHLYQKSILILHIINVVYALGYLYWQAVGITGSVTLFSKIKFDGPFHESSMQELQQNLLFFEWFCSQHNQMNWSWRYRTALEKLLVVVVGFDPNPLKEQHPSSGSDVSDFVSRKKWKILKYKENQKWKRK